MPAPPGPWGRQLRQGQLGPHVWSCPGSPGPTGEIWLGDPTLTAPEADSRGREHGLVPTARLQTSLPPATGPRIRLLSVQCSRFKALHRPVAAFA